MDVPYQLVLNFGGPDPKEPEPGQEDDQSRSPVEEPKEDGEPQEAA